METKEVYGLIYIATNIQNKKVYIGKTSRRFGIRKSEHFVSSKDATALDYNVYFHKGIRKYGWNNFKWRILGYCYSEDELDACEEECIYFYRAYGSDGIHRDSIYGYNILLGGKKGSKGYKFTEEQKEKQRKGILKTYENGRIPMQPNENYGFKKGHSLNKGIIHTEEHNKKISLAKKGSIPWNKGNRHKPLIVRTKRQPKQLKVIKEKKKRILNDEEKRIRSEKNIIFNMSFDLFNKLLKEVSVDKKSLLSIFKNYNIPYQVLYERIRKYKKLDQSLIEAIF